jgi:prepilin-type N-terminal cleavage/methylation domain-containing protein
MSSNSRIKGFSVVELLVALGIVAIVGAGGTASYTAWRAQSQMDTAQKKIIGNLRESQMFAQASLGNSSWGVNLQAGKITLFKGASYAGRDPLSDQTDSLPGNLSITGPTEIIYGRFSGIPLSFGTITISSNNGQKQISVNSKGILSY